jgi:fumarate reductase flavoprotein subunit
VGLSLHGEGWELQRAGNIVGLESELKRLSEETSAVKVSNSLEDLAKWIGIDPDTLESTIKEYNQFCQEGYDALFLKSKRWLLPLRTPPYYTIRCSVLILHTCGGIKINEHLEVVNKEGNPIPGLYAAGDETGGWENVAPSFIMSSVGIGAPAGRIAGRNAAKYAKDRKDG